MAARPLSRGSGAALALLLALGLAPAPQALLAAEQKKVWRALAESERRSASPLASSAAPTARASSDPFPTELALTLVVGAIVGLLLAVGASRGRRRSVPLPKPAAPELEEGNTLERLWRVHLRSRGPKRGSPV